MNSDTILPLLLVLGGFSFVFVMGYAHLRRALLSLDALLCRGHAEIRATLDDGPAPRQGRRRIRAEAAVRVLTAAQRCAVVLDSLDDNIACAVYEALAYEHQELVGEELLCLSDDLPEGTHILALGDLASRLDLAYDDLEAYLAARPEAGAAAMSAILPMTIARQQATAGLLHDLPWHLGSSRCDVPELKMSALDMLGWLRRRAEGDDDTAAA